MQTFLERAKNLHQVDGIADAFDRVAKRLPLQRWADRGQDLLGHPAHPALTDLPIGFWTCSWVLDNVGGRKRAPAAQFLLGVGILSAVPTAAIGLGDATYIEGRWRRVAAIHAVANSVALGLATASFLTGRRRHRGKAVMLNWLAAGAATVGGYLGGALTFESGKDDTASTSGESTESWPAPSTGNGVPSPASTSGSPR